ncbi:MAG: methyltransferase domain-containing protein [Candidatus Competibacteraceae bacterium]|jgi:SAM-dependent methyltransferase|nr:methyltransferase domain-containing protein [Candidatus Competibacteraceae bacterium]
MNDETRSRWDQRYHAEIGAQQPAQVLSSYAYLLPESGSALDLACGLGANALLLANHGLETWAWDISQVAIARLDEAARKAGLPLHAEVRDVMAQPPPPDSFDVIVVSRFLERELADTLQAALRSGGLLYYQTFTRVRAAENGPRNPAFLLGENELLQLFQEFKILLYREEGRVGDLQQGFRNEAMLIAQKV